MLGEGVGGGGEISEHAGDIFRARRTFNERVSIIPQIRGGTCLGATGSQGRKKEGNSDSYRFKRGDPQLPRDGRPLLMF